MATIKKVAPSLAASSKTFFSFLHLFSFSTSPIPSVYWQGTAGEAAGKADAKSSYDPRPSPSLPSTSSLHPSLLSIE